MSDSSNVATTPATSSSNSAGVAASHANWLDTHFLAMQPEYEEALRWVGIQPGWHVLDAGCGAGSYLPLLTGLVGPHGRISAMDVDPQNVARIQAAATGAVWPAPVAAREGNLIRLPYEDAAFDAVWCANVLQYLTEAELEIALPEMARVTKPGGLVAIKDADLSGYQVQPGPPEVFTAQLDLARQWNDTQMLGLARTSNLAAWMRHGGIKDVAQKHVPMVRTQPLRAVERRHFENVFALVATWLRGLGAAPQLQAIWDRLADLDAPDHILNNPDFMFRAMQIVFVGRV